MGETYGRGQMIETTETLRDEKEYSLWLENQPLLYLITVYPPLCDLQDGLSIYGIRARVKC